MGTFDRREKVEKNPPREKDAILDEIKRLVQRDGYLYSLLLAMFSDFHVELEKLHEDDVHSKLSFNEAYLLLGLIVKQDDILKFPVSSGDLLEMKSQTYRLLRELHDSFHSPFLLAAKNPDLSSNPLLHSDSLTEPIFYSGTGVYDFQYMELWEQRYKYDLGWLRQNKGFDFHQVKAIYDRIDDRLHKKSLRVRIHPKELIESMKADLKIKHPGEDFDHALTELLPTLDLYQYANLFYDDSMRSIGPDTPEYVEAGWVAFYRNLLDLFTISSDDVVDMPGHDAFIANFSAVPGKYCNQNFKKIGDYNNARSHPLIHIGIGRYLIPLRFVLAEAIYEGPYYWMISDPSYKDQSGTNRGNAGEEIGFNFLSKIFKGGAFQRVKVSSKKGRDSTDIDALCFIGNKALCVQVKSQKLTELSKKGNESSIRRDFGRAVQEAFDQGQVARAALLNKSSKFFDEFGEAIEIPTGLDEVYIMVLTTDSYPSLTHQASLLLNKPSDIPSPLVLTVFDLEIISYYLSDPFEFLYYVRQRINLANVIRGNDELSYLGYHLIRKLWLDPGVDYISIDYCWAQAIDRNYLPYRRKIKTSADTDPIANRWRSLPFENLCDEIKRSSSDNTIDILFCLFDLSGGLRESLLKSMNDVKSMVQQDGRFHSISITPSATSTDRLGISYFVIETASEDELLTRLCALCVLSKYKNKGSIWIGFGSLKDSPDRIDAIYFDQSEWVFDSSLEKPSKKLKGTLRSFEGSSKNGRNDWCRCGSGIKFKNCCGR